MKILIITSSNIPKPQIDATVDIKAWQNTANVNLIDYDGIIFDVDNLEQTRKENDDFYLNELESQISSQLLVDILNNENSFIWIIGNPKIKLERKSILNSIGIDIDCYYKKGTNITKEDNGNKLNHYWKNIKSYDYYLGKRFHFIQGDNRVPEIDGYNFFYSHNKLTTNSDYIIGADIRIIHEGNLFFIGDFVIAPTLNHDSQKSINTALEIYFEKKATTEPDWAKEISAYGQKEIEEQIKTNEDEIEKISKNNEQLNEKLKETRTPIKMLYEDGKQLEKAIKESLRQVDINVVEPEKKNEEEFYIEQDEYLFVAEVKSTINKTINKQGLHQSQEWAAKAFLEKKKKYKPILIVSNQYNLELSKRNENPIEQNLLPFAKDYNIAIIKIKDLYDLLQRIKKGELSKNEFLNIIKTTSGILEIDSSKPK